MPIHSKINAVMRLVKGVEKTRTNSHGKFKYAGHEDVNEKLRGHFADLGIVREARMVSCQVIDGGTILAHCEVSYVDIDCVNLDPSLHRITIPMWAVQPSQTSKGGVTAQQIGQALSYAVKNVEFKLFALTGDNEADSDSSEAYNPNEKPAESINDAAHTRAGELLKMLTAATSIEDLNSTRAAFKAEWNELKHVSGLAEHMVEVTKAARERLAKGAA